MPSMEGKYHKKGEQREDKKALFILMTKLPRPMCDKNHTHRTSMCQLVKLKTLHFLQDVWFLPLAVITALPKSKSHFIMWLNFTGLIKKQINKNGNSLLVYNWPTASMLPVYSKVAHVYCNQTIKRMPLLTWRLLLKQPLSPGEPLLLASKQTKHGNFTAKKTLKAAQFLFQWLFHTESSS